MTNPTVTLGIGGDASGLDKAVDKATASTRRLADDVDASSSSLRSSSSRIGEGFDRAGDGADGAETRIMGLKDTVDGTATIMAGPGEQGIAAYLQGWADLASGLANFAIPAIKAVAQGLVGQVAEMAKTTAATVASVATQVAQWVVLGAQATLHAAKVAAAWLVSIWPIVAVGAAVAGLVYLFVTHWDTIKDVVGAGARWVGDRIGDIIGFFESIPGRIGDVMGGLAEVITAPYRTAFNAIANLWNNTVGKLSFRAPSWIPGIGGKGWDVPDIPTWNQGVARSSSAGMTVVVNSYSLDPAMAGTHVVDAIRHYERTSGPVFAPA